MRHEWSLSDEEQFNSLSTEKLLGWILDVGVDEGAQVLLFWRTWYIRNNVTHPTDKLSVEGSARFLAKYWTELCSTQHQRSSFDSKGKELVVDSLVAKKKNVTKATNAAWEAPTTGWLKMNVDGSFVPGSKEGGIGVVIRDDKGRVLLTAWSYISKGSDVEEIEALACREGLKLAVEWCKQRLILESDCRSLVETIKKWERNRSQLASF